jgi:L-aminopeptidase/D-esterase-like protein
VTGIAGLRVGHWTDAEARTGCTVLLFPAGTVASGEIRGGAPGTREWDLLAPERLVDRVDAVVLTGGSAFGLAACDGVVRWCEERGLGFPTGAGPIPIVVGAVIFDLAVGDAAVRPGPDEGYAACVAAGDGPIETGSVGAGTGATVDKWLGPDAARPGALVCATEQSGGVTVTAVLAVNAYGSVIQPGQPRPPLDMARGRAFGPMENTTIGVVVTDARLDKSGCLLMAQSAHDGLARALEPVHTRVDGDALVAAATGQVDAPLELVRALAARAVEAAILSLP